MNLPAEFINSIIETCDPFIRKYGGEEGYKRFRMDYAQSISKTTDIGQFACTHIESIENKEPDSPLYSRALVSLYAMAEKNSKAPDFLKEWVLERLLRIGDGESADVVFHLKARAGVRKTKRQHNQLRCACFVVLKTRKGMKKSKAVEACANKFGPTTATVWSFLKGVNIGEHISDKTLIFFRDNDISSDYFSN